MSTIFESITIIFSGLHSIFTGTVIFIQGCIALNRYVFDMLSTAFTEICKNIVWITKLLSATFQIITAIVVECSNYVEIVITELLFRMSPLITLFQYLLTCITNVIETCGYYFLNTYSVTCDFLRETICNFWAYIVMTLCNFKSLIWIFLTNVSSYLFHGLQFVMQSAIATCVNIKILVYILSSYIVERLQLACWSAISFISDCITCCRILTVNCFYSLVYLCFDFYNLLFNPQVVRIFISSTGAVTFLIVLYTSIKIMHRRGLTFPGFSTDHVLQQHYGIRRLNTDSDIDSEVVLAGDPDTGNETSSDDDEHLEFEIADPNDSSDDGGEDTLLNVQLPPPSRYSKYDQLSYRHDRASNIDLNTTVLQERSVCVVCQDQMKTVLVLPCRHMCLCVDCAYEVVSLRRRRRQTCPLCRSPIETIMNVYL